MAGIEHWCIIAGISILTYLGNGCRVVMHVVTETYTWSLSFQQDSKKITNNREVVKSYK